jgi:hypothetical protein
VWWYRMPAKTAFPSIKLPLRATSARSARRFVGDTLAKAGLPGAVEAAVLLTSELVANSLLYARSEITVVVIPGRASAVIKVYDASSQKPIRREAREDSTSGRGLELVEALASSWGVEDRAEEGKCVWLEVSA